MGENSEKGFWQRWVKQALSLGNDTPNTERAQEKSCFMNTFFWLWRGEFSSSRVRQAPMASIRRLWGKEDTTVLNSEISALNPANLAFFGIIAKPYEFCPATHHL